LKNLRAALIIVYASAFFWLPAFMVGPLNVAFIAWLLGWAVGAFAWEPFWTRVTGSDTGHEFSVIAVIAVIGVAFFGLFAADLTLQRAHHPINTHLNGVGWIGDPQPPADPGDCDSTVRAC
jgi:hypothetical protein